MEREVLPSGEVSWYEFEPGSHVARVVFVSDVPRDARRTFASHPGTTGAGRRVQLEGNGRLSLDEKRAFTVYLAQAAAADGLTPTVMPTEHGIRIEAVADEVGALNKLLNQYVLNARDERTQIELPPAAFGADAVRLAASDISITVSDIEIVIVDSTVTEPASGMVAGGSPTTKIGTTSMCTSGFPVVEIGTGREGFVGAGHCDHHDHVVDWDAYLWRQATLRATARSSPWAGDMAFWSIDDGTSVGPGFWYDSGFVQQLQGFAYAAVGQSVCKYGWATGHSCGTVDATWTCAHIPGYGLSCSLSRAAGLLGDEGDSGGPIFSVAPDQVGLGYGMTTSILGSPPNPTYVYFTPFGSALWLFNLIEKTW